MTISMLIIIYNAKREGKEIKPLKITKCKQNSTVCLHFFLLIPLICETLGFRL